jgi:uncharacterized membrane protein
MAAERIAIQDASAWILRAGVVVSVTVMLTGLVLAFVRQGSGLSVQGMETAPFTLHLTALGHGLGRLDAFALMELGVLLLVATPILRVLTAMVLFAVEEHDRLYTAVTALVLVMTLGSVLFIR